MDERTALGSAHNYPVSSSSREEERGRATTLLGISILDSGAKLGMRETGEGRGGWAS